MSRDKQILEMARDICECFNNNGTCYQDDKPCNCKCDSFTDAQYLYEKGYRKASDVAREIIEEAEKIFMFTCSSLEAYTDWQNFKKKYIGKDTNVTTYTED